MARTRVFERLQGWARQLRANAREEGAPRASAITRRDFVRGTGATLVGLGLAPKLAGCAEGAGGERGPQTVAVIGAGIAGLHCAYRLQQAGVDVRVFEASARAGGRMFTARGMFPDEQVAELGGELIDSNHRFIRALVDEFELALDDRLHDAEELAADTWYVNGAQVSDATLLADFEQVAPAMLRDMENADADEDAFEALDQTSLLAYLEETVPPAHYPALHAVLVSAYRGEFGLECEQQSALNLIYLIGSDEPDPFRIFGESDERYHIHGGNDQLTNALAEALGDRIETERRLVAARSAGATCSITLEDAEGERETLSFGRVVFALPFTLLRQVDLTGLALSEEKRAIIEELGYGTNAKVMGAFSARVWRTEHGALGSITSDLPLQQTWDSSIGQDGESGLLTNFLGGERGVASGEGSAEAWYTAQLEDLERVYPGAAAAYVSGSAVRMHWPTHEFTRGSYTCYRPGQWSYWTREGVAEGNLHFCGEHTSPEFQGWMEGGAETGGRVAKEILDAFGLKLPEALAALIDDDALLVGSEQSLRAFFPRRLMRLALRAR